MELKEGNVSRVLLMPAVIGSLWLVGLTALALLGYGVKRHHFEAAGLVFGVGLFAVASPIDGWPYMRPLPLALWQLILAAGGGWTALHVVNVVIHAVNSVLVARIGSAWLGPRAGVVAGTIFAMFPASTEAVAWNAGAFDMIATCCVLLAVTMWPWAHVLLFVRWRSCWCASLDFFPRKRRW